MSMSLPNWAVHHPRGSIAEELSLRIQKAQLAFSNLHHLWRRNDIKLSTKGKVYSAAVRSVLLYGSETLATEAEDVRRLSVFDHRCLRSIVRFGGTKD